MTPQHGIINFTDELKRYNEQNLSKNKQIESFHLIVQVNKSNDVELVRIAVDPTPSSLPAAHILPDLENIKINLTKTIPAYFSKFYETLNQVRAGTYDCMYEIPVSQSDQRVSGK